MSPVERRTQLRYSDTIEQQFPLTLHVLLGARRERLELRGETLFCLGHRCRDRFAVLADAARKFLLARIERVAVESDPGAFFEIGEYLGPHPVDQMDAVGDQHLRAEV